MIRRTLPGLALMAGLGAVTLQAGGWGVITVQDFPDYARVGRALPLQFTVMPHGQQRAKGLQGSVDAVSGRARISAAFSETSEAGLYQTSLVLPAPGAWVVTINAGYKVTLPAIEALGSDHDSAPPLPAAERGRRLFVAKGCATCHQHTLTTPNVSVNIGPALVAHKFQPDFLARMLADPVANIPPRPESPVRMPNLHLKQPEIASLVAFINAGPSAAAAR